MTEKKHPTLPHRLSVFLTTTLLTLFLTQPLAEAADLYVASLFEPSFSNGRIETLNTNGTGRYTLREVGGGLRGIAVDETGNGLFWSDVDSDRIERVPLDSPGSSPTGVVTSGLLFPQDLDYSPSAGALFWTDATANLIERADLDGGNRTPLFSANSTAIAVDEVHGKIYSEDRSSASRGAIVRSNFDGTGYEVVVTDVPTATNIAIDPIHETIYWTSSAGLANSDGGVYRVGFDGQGFDEIFLIDGTYLSTGGIAVDPAEGKVYFGQEYEANRTDIYRIDLDGGNPEVVATGFGNMSGHGPGPLVRQNPRRLRLRHRRRRRRPDALATRRLAKPQHRRRPRGVANQLHR